MIRIVEVSLEQVESAPFGLGGYYVRLSRTKGLKVSNAERETPEQVEWVMTEMHSDEFEMALEARRILGCAVPEVFERVVVKTPFGDYAAGIIMEHIPGKTVAEKYGSLSSAPYSVELAVDELVQKAKKAGLWLHDVHAGNVMVDSRGRVRLIDFGMAKLYPDEEVA